MTLTSDQTNELIAQAQAGNRDALASILQEHEGLIGYVISRYTSPHLPRGVEPDDLMQVGRIAMMNSIAGFDPSKAKFSTYATNGIRFSLWRFLIDMAKHDHVLNSGEPLELVDEWALDTFDRADAAMDCSEQYEAVAAIARMDDLALLHRRFCDGHTLQDIASDWGMSKERVRQKQAKAIARIRDHFQPGPQLQLQFVA